MSVRTTKKGENVRNQIVSLFQNDSMLSFNEIYRNIRQNSELSEASIRNYLQQLLSQKILFSKKQGKFLMYGLSLNVEIEHSFSLKDSNLTEDYVWRTYLSDSITKANKAAKEILDYAFSEMFNNVLSHSNASKVTVKLIEDAMKTYIVVEDNGIGIFKKIKNDLSLQDEHQSLLELAKGKFTSNPKEHSGEGIFFSSRACDLFLIHSGSLTYSLDINSDIGKFIETDKDIEDDNFSGTIVLMAVNNSSSNSLKRVFDKYTSSTEDKTFSKTVVPVKFLRYKDEGIISRSQAKRLLARFDKFKYVVLDFSGIDDIGQAFADEIFRVYVNSHPEIEISYIEANKSIKNMIDHVSVNR